ncbi:MAG TPA: PQQ-binding-like beta-propeller repeat protein [Rubricoccaceae bacterium]|jgi:outer membrane protein assembly factor BamB
MPTLVLSRSAWVLVALATSLMAGCGTIRLDRPLVPAALTVPPAPPLVRAWEIDVGGAFGPAAATVAMGHVVVGTRNGEAVVVDVVSGRRIGGLDVGASIEASAVLSPDGATLFVPVARGRTAVVAHGLLDGARRWRWRGEGPAEAADAGLILAGGVVVVPLHGGTTLGLDAATGTERWRAPGASGAQTHAAPLVLPGGLVAVADDRGTVRALEAATGAIRWTADVGVPVYVAPALAGARLIVSTTRGTVAALDAATGRSLWTAELDASGSARVTTASADGDRAVVGLTDGRVVALDAGTGTVVWTWKATGAVVAPPLLAGATVYVGTMDRLVVALDAATGAETFRVEVRGRVKSALAVAAGRLIVLSEPRHVTAFDAAPGLAARP